MDIAGKILPSGVRASPLECMVSLRDDVTVVTGSSFY